jgi:hypothetical protein
VPHLHDMKSWTDRLGHAKLRTFTDEDGHFWLEQNSSKSTKWAKLAREGHEVAWEFESPGGTYTGRMLVQVQIRCKPERPCSIHAIHCALNESLTVEREQRLVIAHLHVARDVPTVALFLPKFGHIERIIQTLY